MTKPTKGEGVVGYGVTSGGAELPIAIRTVGDGMVPQSVQGVNASMELYNGATLDAMRGNTEGIALTAAARTATTDSLDIVNYNGRGVAVFLRVTAASGTGGLQVRIAAKDPVTGQYVNMNSAPTAITATGTTMYVLYPGSTGTGAVAQNTGMVLPRTFRITVQHADGSSYTYSVGYSIII